MISFRSPALCLTSRQQSLNKRRVDLTLGRAREKIKWRFRPRARGYLRCGPRTSAIICSEGGASFLGVYKVTRALPPERQCTEQARESVRPAATLATQRSVGSCFSDHWSVDLWASSVVKSGGKESMSGCESLSENLLFISSTYLHWVVWV